MPDQTKQPDGTVVDPHRSIDEEMSDIQQHPTPQSGLVKLALLLGA